MENRMITLTVRSITPQRKAHYLVICDIDNEELPFVIEVESLGGGSMRQLTVLSNQQKLSPAADAFVKFQRDFWDFLNGKDLNFPLSYKARRRPPT